MDKLIPLNKKLVVEPPQKKEVTEGGIILPETSKEKTPTRGKVLSIALDSMLLKNNQHIAGVSFTKIEVGEDIVFSKYAGAEVKVMGEDGNEKTVYLINSDDVLAVIKKAQA